MSELANSFVFQYEAGEEDFRFVSFIILFSDHISFSLFWQMKLSLTEISVDILLYLIGKLNIAGPYAVRTPVVSPNCCKVVHFSVFLYIDTCNLHLFILEEQNFGKSVRLGACSFFFFFCLNFLGLNYLLCSSSCMFMCLCAQAACRHHHFMWSIIFSLKHCLVYSPEITTKIAY